MHENLCFTPHISDRQFWTIIKRRIHFIVTFLSNFDPVIHITFNLQRNSGTNIAIITQQQVWVEVFRKRRKTEIQCISVIHLACKRIRELLQKRLGHRTGFYISASLFLWRHRINGRIDTSQSKKCTFILHVIYVNT